ncbi:uncharacterized protein LOC117228805 [Megalopta genalis]|uniref:uncharacterized protein LOC117228805 n=1 Tax=Megalopta genalis TaxID=115081 RepID=UPI001443865B|nr:uncharacterized protein LOC117228805 [Megalopta genalis]
MDASFGPNQLGANEAHANNTTPVLPQNFSSLSEFVNETKKRNESTKRILKSDIAYKKHGVVSNQYIKHNNETKSNECTIQNSMITRETTVSNVVKPVSPLTSTPYRINPDISVKNKCLNIDGNDCQFTQNNMDIYKDNNTRSIRSVSSPQLTIKPLTRSKVYRKASLKSMNLSNSTLDNSTQNHCRSNNLASNNRIINISNCSITFTDKEVPFSYLSATTQGIESNDTQNKWNMGEVHITCNPLSTPYPYSTPHRNIISETVTEPLDEEPKSRSCGSFLPILSLIPQTVISFQYLSPKMKFSWWRNKIS